MAKAHNALYIFGALYAIARPSVRPSVCHTGGSYKNGNVTIEDLNVDSKAEYTA